MKYAALIQLGAADGPLEDLGDQSPLEAADIPTIRELARTGKVAAVSALQDEDQLDNAASLARAVLSLLGFDPRPAEAIRASLSGSAVSAGVMRLDLGEPAPWCLRASLVNTASPTGGPATGVVGADAVLGPEVVLTDAQADALWTAIERRWAHDHPELMLEMQLAGSGVQRVLIDRSPGGLLSLEAPSPTPGERVSGKMPGAGPPGAAAKLHQLMRASSAAIAQWRSTSGADRLDLDSEGAPPTTVWFDDLGRRPTLRPFGERFGISALVLTDDPGSEAVAGWAGLQARSVESQRLGEAAVDALASYDAAIVIDTSAARAALAGDALSRQRAIEAFDSSCVALVAARLQDFGDPERDPSARGWRLMVTPGVRADAAEQAMVADVVPVLLAGAWIRTMVTRTFTEEAAQAADLRVDRAHELMEYFLLGGLARARGVPKSDLGKGSLWETAG